MKTVDLDALLEQGRKEDFSGYDPFDGLNSTLFDGFGARHIPLARIAWLQLHKRSPVNLRELVGVRKRRNAKGIALTIPGLLERHRCSHDGTAANAAQAAMGQKPHEASAVNTFSPLVMALCQCLRKRWPRYPATLLLPPRSSRSLRYAADARACMRPRARRRAPRSRRSGRRARGAGKPVRWVCRRA